MPESTIELGKCILIRDKIAFIEKNERKVFLTGGIGISLDIEEFQKFLNWWRGGLIK